jgi:hypothetical protein
MSIKLERYHEGLREQKVRLPDRNAFAPDTPDQPSTGESAQIPAWARGRFTLEDLQHMSQDDDETGCLELKDFLGELQGIVGKKGH